jgi:hypothetical protein
MAHGANSRFAWGNKKAGVEYVLTHRRELHAYAECFHAGNMEFNELILKYLQIPGLGIVKAEFLAQLTVGEGACLDVHNLRMLGLSESAFKTPKTLRVESIQKRISAYNAVWRAVNPQSSYWWNEWCDAYASRPQTKSPVKYQSGSDVSAAHLCAIESKGVTCTQ